MTQELLYTSAPKGLKPGSRGFCTVVSTQGLPAPLVTALEGLSAYRPVYPHSDPRAAHNPVNWAHVLLAAGGRPLHVLSRVADYGLDYSQRSNKLAHHLALSDQECVSAGPAWVLEQPGVLQTAWDGEVRTLAQGRKLPNGSNSARIAKAWQAATGDAGWAGVVAEALHADPNRQIFLLFAAGQNLLPLVGEVLALLPPALRWKVTFSTYATQIPPNATCQWRCHLADSPEAQQSLRFVNALRIDLTKPMGAATGGALVEAARTGDMVFATATSAAIPIDEPQEDVEFDSVPSAWNSPVPVRQVEPSGAGGYALQREVPARPERLPPPLDLDGQVTSRRRGWTATILFPIVATVLVAAIGGAVWLGLRHRGPAQIATKVSTPQDAEDRPATSPEAHPNPAAGKQKPENKDNGISADEGNPSKHMGAVDGTGLPTPPSKQQVQEISATEPTAQSSPPAATPPPQVLKAPYQVEYLDSAIHFSSAATSFELPIASEPGSVLLYPRLAYGDYAWRSNGNAIVAAPKNNGLAATVLTMKASAAPGVNSIAISAKPNRHEFRLCAILLPTSKRILAFRESPKCFPTMPSEIEIAPNWDDSGHSLGVPEVQFGESLTIQIGNRSLRLDKSAPHSVSRGKRSPPVVTYAVVDASLVAPLFNLPLINVGETMRVEVNRIPRGLRFVLKPQSPEAHETLRKGLSSHYAEASAEIIKRAEWSSLDGFKAMRPGGEDISSHRQKLDKLIEEEGVAEQSAKDRGKDDEAVLPGKHKVSATEMRTLVDQFDSWLASSQQLFSDMKAARIVVSSVRYRLEGAPAGTPEIFVELLDCDGPQGSGDGQPPP